jgi:hypothetical protein
MLLAHILDIVVIKVSLRIVGINRSLSYTANSILSQLIQPLSRPRIFDLDTTITLIQPAGSIENPRSGESGMLEGEIPAALGRERVTIIKQGDLERQAGTHFRKLLELRDPYDDDGKSLRNAVVFWQAMEIVGRLIPEDADVVIFSRPDLIYRRKVLIFWRVVVLFLLKKFGKHHLLVPSWGNFGGINDRFAVLSRSLVPQYFGRLEVLNRWPLDVPLSSEVLLASSMEGASISRSIYAPMARVRLGGRIEQADAAFTEASPLVIRLRYALVRLKSCIDRVTKQSVRTTNSRLENQK